MTIAYDYALLRVVPSVPRGDAETVGVVLHARQARFLGLRIVRAPDPLAARWPGLDAALLRRYLGAVEAVVAGGAAAAPLGLLPPSERFHWLTAQRSTVLQSSPIRTGLTHDPAATLDQIATSLSPDGDARPPGTSRPEPSV